MVLQYAEKGLTECKNMNLREEREYWKITGNKMERELLEIYKKYHPEEFE